jgi:hypothetical protein
LKEFTKYTAFIILVITAFGSCRQLPEYPVEPSIEFNLVSFRKTDTTNFLTVELNFRDGDGDLGLDNFFDTRDPYNAFWIYIKGNGDTLKLSDRNTSPYDTLPPYIFPYSCTNYLVDQADTFYIQQNQNQYNIFVDFYVRKNGDYELFDWITWNPPNCGESYNGRFPILNESGKERPLEGILKYKMEGKGFEVIFKNDTLKLDISIQDRALHRSNVVQSQEFILKDITVN